MNKEHYDVVLVSPPSRMINHYRPPVSLLYVAGYLQKMGMKVKIIDVPMKEIVRDKKFFEHIDEELEKIQQQMVDEFKKIETKIVGITFYTPEYFEVFDLARKYKTIDPKIKILVGGTHPTFYPDEILNEENCPIDFAVIGEGELTTYELAKTILENKISYETIDGIAFRDTKTGQIVKTKFRPLCENLDEISHPAYDLIDMEYYTNASPYAIRGCFLRSMYVLATRGCPSQCTFCVSKKLRSYSGGGRYTRVRSAESLIAEVEELKNKYKIDSFYFIDDLFTINKENVIKFCNEIRKRKISILWGCSAKVTTLNEEVIKNMAAAGCIQIDFGVERGSDQALRLVKKGITLKIIKDIFALCHKYNIRTFANFIVNIPEETEQDLNDIIKLMDELRSEIVSINIFTPYQGTEIYDNSSYKFTKEEYPMLTGAAALIYKYPEKLKFAKHDIDLIEWSKKYNKEYNRIWDNLKFYLSLRYWLVLLRSKDKMNYAEQFGLLVREVINQKLN